MTSFFTYLFYWMLFTNLFIPLMIRFHPRFGLFILSADGWDVIQEKYNLEDPTYKNLLDLKKAFEDVAWTFAGLGVAMFFIFAFLKLRCVIFYGGNRPCEENIPKGKLDGLRKSVVIKKKEEV